MNQEVYVAPSSPAKSGHAFRTTLGFMPLLAATAMAEPVYGQSSSGQTRLDPIVVQGQTAAPPVSGPGDDSGGVTGMEGAPGVPGSAFLTNSLSSPKSTAPILDTPQTISVIPQELIQQRGARNLTEALRNTPGISFNAGENGFATSSNNFQIRGFDASANIFIDGARDNGSYKRDTFNVEAVEVIKGAAADNGRGGPGGYVNIVTKTPLPENFVAGTSEIGWDNYDSDPRMRQTIDVNQMITSGTAIRVNAMIEDSGVPGREMAEDNSWGVAPSIAFGMDTNFRAIFSYEHLTRRDLPDWGVPGATIPGLVTFRSATAGARRDAFYGLRSDFDDVDADAVMARFEYDIAPNVMLSNQTRWSQVDRFARYTIPTGFTPPSTATTQTQFYDRETTTLTNLTNLHAKFNTGAWRHTVSTGIDLTREESDANRYGTANGTTNLFFPDPNRPTPFVAPTQFNDVTVDTVAGYLFDTIEMSRRWELTGGVRVEQYDVKINSLDAAGLPTGNYGIYEDSETTVGGKIGLVYKPVENASFYGAYSVSHMPPGSFLSNPDISRTGDNAFPGFVPGADPVKADNYEVGAKFNLFDGRLMATAALFRTEKKNVPFAPRVGGIPTLAGYGEQIIEGLELGLAGNITDAWQVFGGVVFLDTERKHSPELDALMRADRPNDYDTYLTTSGDELAFTPNVTANLWTTYRFDNGFTVGGGFQYVGSSWLGRPDDALRIIPNGRFGNLPGYFLVDAMIAYELTDNVDLQFNIDNVFDETYAVSTNWPGTRATLGAPRTFRVSTRYKF